MTSPTEAEMRKYYLENPEKCFEYNPAFFASARNTKLMVGLAKRNYPKNKLAGVLAAAKVCPPIIKKGVAAANKKSSRKTSRRKTSRRKTSRRKTSRRKTSRRKTSRRKTSKR